MRTRSPYVVALGVVFATLLAQPAQGDAVTPLLPQSDQGECLGAVVSDSYGLVLLPAHCAENLGTHGNSNEVAIQNGKIGGVTKVQIQRTKLHPSYRAGEAAFNFALGFAEPAALKAMTPVLNLDTGSFYLTSAKLAASTVDLAVCSVRQAESGLQTVTRGKIALASSGACGAEETTSSSANSVVGCFTGTWSAKAECDANFSGHQLVVLTFHSMLLGARDFLYGFASRSSRCSEAGDQVFAVGHFKNALEFIQKELERLKSGSEADPGSEASSGDSATPGNSSVASPVPTGSSPSSVPGGEANGGSLKSSGVDAGSSVASPVPTGSSPNPVTGGDANSDSSPSGSSIVASELLPQSVQGECLGVLVDERFLLFPAHCAENVGKDGNSDEVAIFGDTISTVKKVLIQRTTIHPLYRPGEVAFDFALGFAGPWSEFMGSSKLRLDTSLHFQDQAEHPKPEDLSVYSIRQAETGQTKLTATYGRIAFASSGACGAEESASSANSRVGCYIGTWGNKAECEDNFSGHQIIVQRMHYETGDLGYDYLSGFVSHSSRCSESGDQVYAVNHFENALEFIDNERQLLDSGFDTIPGGEASSDDSSTSGSAGFAPALLPQSDHGECLGVVVSDGDSFVLLPAHCAKNLGKHGNNNEVALQDKTYNPDGVAKVQIQKFKIHPLYRPGETAFDFALGLVDSAALVLLWSDLRMDRFLYFQSQAEHPKAEDLSVYSFRQAETDENELTLTRAKVAFLSGSACSAGTTGSGVNSSVGCLIGTWSEYAECDDNFSGHQFIVQTMHYDSGYDEDHLSGFVSRSSQCSRTGYQVFAVSHFENAREFVNSELEHLDFSDYDPVPAGEVSGDSSASGSSSPTNPAPTSSSTSPVPGGEANGDSSSSGSSGLALTLLPQSGLGECIGALVSYSDGLVLLPAHCAEKLGKHGNNNKVAIQGHTLNKFTKFPIQKTKIHPLYRPGKTAFDFALGLVNPSALTYSLLRLDTTSYFQSQADSPNTKDLSVYSIRQAATERNESEVQTLTRAKVAFASSGACGSEEAGSSANSSNIACFIGKWSNKAECEDNFSGHQIIVQAMHLPGYSDDNFLSGFVSHSSRCSEAGEQVFAVNRFKNAREFVNGEQAHLDSSGYDPVPEGEASGNSSTLDLTEYEEQLVTFYNGLSPLNCSGALIAPRFFLTTSTCVSRHKITHVALGKTGTPQLLQSNRTVLHPRFGSGYSRFDVALLELELPLSKAPISLSSDPGLVGDKLVRVSQGGVADQVAIDELSKCPSPELSPSDTASGALVCVNQTLSSSGSGSLGGDSILIQKSQDKLLLKGIELPVKNCLEGSQCYSGIYISISSLANFINAFASGQLWDFQAPPPTPSPAPTSMPTTPSPSKPCVGTGCNSPIVSPEPSEPPSPTLPPAPAPTSLAPPPPDYPYVVGLRVEKEGRNFCGGVLIDSYHVITAAHCVDDGIASWVSVGSPTSSGSAPESITVASIKIHPQYKSKGMLNDVAVLELGYFAESKNPPDLDTLSDHPDKTAATMLSFGTPSSNTLKGVGVPIWGRKICEAQEPNVDGSIVCAGGVAGIDACSGDSGSPLIMKDPKGDDVLVGLVSSGFGCGDPGVPGFYTRVSTVRGFVSSNIIPSELVEPTQRPGIISTNSPTAAAIVPHLSPGTDTTAPPTTSTGKPSGAGSQSTSNNPRSDGSLKTDTASRAPSPTSSGAPITAVKLDDNLSLATQQKVLNIFIGDSSLVPSSLLAKLLSPDKQVVLLSTGDVQGIVDAINRNSMLPLNQRANRFGTITDHRQAASIDTCAAQ